MRKRATRAELLERLMVIEEAIIDAWSVSAMVRSAKEKWGISQHQTERYVGMVYKRWARQDEETSRQNLARAIRARKRIIRKAYETDDLKTVLAAEDSLAKLQSLFLDRVEHSGEIGLSLADLIKRSVNGEEIDGNRIRSIAPMEN